MMQFSRGTWGPIAKLPFWRILAVSTVVATSVLMTAPGAGASGWVGQGVQSPSVPNGQLTALSCVSASSCVSVGSFVDRTGVAEPLAARWDGSSWAVDHVPAPDGNTYARLYGVSCTAGSACVAVGGYIDGNGSHPLIERWDGSSWTTESISDSGAAAGSLQAVSCTSSTACVAVGSTAGVDARFTAAILVARWDGASWQLQSISNPDGRLDGVSCAAANACLAVGTAPTSSYGDQPIAERWDGSTWTVESPPLLSGGTSASLDAVSCASATTCTAVGSDGTPFVERWDDGHWTVQSTPTPPSSPASFSSVSCPTPTSCTAVGIVNNPASNNANTLAEVWDGSSWTVQPTANPSANSDNRLNAVVCTSSDTCMADGTVGSGLYSATTFPLVETLSSGSWTSQAGPAPDGGTFSQLHGVSCNGTNACIAVGSDVSGSHTVPLAEQWNGSSWSVQSMPLPSGTTFELYGVSCSAANACIAVGTSGRATRWDGTSWTQQPTAVGSDSTLLAVSCPTATSCVAVGSTTNGNGIVAESWDGTSWTAEQIPIPSGETGTLNGVSCTTATICVAVGTAGGHPLAARWNGISWTLEQTQDPIGRTGGTLTSISCTGVLSCEAVGYSGAQPFAEQDAAGAWTAQSVSTPIATSDAVLLGVSCSSQTDCSAVGWLWHDSEAMLAEHWNGTSWTAEEPPHEETPIESDEGTQLQSVSCQSATWCAGVGYHMAEIDFPLAETYTGPAAEPVNSAPPTISGSAHPGDTLREEHGSWTNGPTEFYYQWERCDAGGGNCQAIFNAVSSRYVPSSFDDGYTIRVIEWANHAGAVSAPAESAATAPIAEPALTTPPSPVGPAGPSVAVWTPDYGARYSMGEVVLSKFSCSDGAGGPGIRSCIDQDGHESGSRVDTSSVGSHTYTITATSEDGQTNRLSIPYTVAAGPRNTARPAIAGSPKAGQTLSCRPGAWMGNPARYQYQWSRNHTRLFDAFGRRYLVGKLDEGSTLSCTVTAANTDGIGSSATSAAVTVAAPIKANCPLPRRSGAGNGLGVIQLGMTRKQAHRALRHSQDHTGHYQDFFCLTPTGIRVGYASAGSLRYLTPVQQRRLKNRVVWISTANPLYAVDGIRAGASLSAVQLSLPGGQLLQSGQHHWYLARTDGSTAIFKVDGGGVDEVGIAESQLITTRQSEVLLVTSFG
jgi:hypothetical protein